jgi:hypothetical protein
MERSRRVSVGRRTRGAARMGAAIGAAALLLATAPLVSAEEHEGEEELPTPPTEMTLSQSGFSVPAATCSNPDLNPLINEEMGLPTSATFISLTFAGGATGDPAGDVFDVSYDLTSGEMVIGALDTGFPENTTVVGTWDGVTGDFAGTMTVPDSTIEVEVPPIPDPIEIGVSITVGAVTGNISPEDFGGTLNATASINLTIAAVAATCEIGPIALALGTDPVERPDPPPTTAPQPPVTPEVENGTGTGTGTDTPPPAAPVGQRPAFTG